VQISREDYGEKYKEVANRRRIEIKKKRKRENKRKKKEKVA